MTNSISLNGRPAAPAASQPSPGAAEAAPRFSINGRPAYEPGAGVATQAAVESFALAPPGEAATYNAPGPMDASVLPFDTAARHWLGAAEFPREVGSSLLAAMHRAESSRGGQPLTDAQRELAARATEARLPQLLGETHKADVELAQRLAHHIEAKRPGFLKYLGESNVGNDPLFITQFALQAKLLAARGVLK